MQQGIFYALLSMCFAGFTSVIAKFGLSNISSDVGTVVRTTFVFIFTCLFGIFAVQQSDWKLLGKPNFFWLAISAATTAASWICYYRAIKLADVSKVALIDKGSVIVAVLLSFWLLNEPVTAPKLIGGILIIAGLFVIALG